MKDKTAWWKAKLLRYGERSFGPNVARYAVICLGRLIKTPSGIKQSESIRTMAKCLHIPPKYLSRTLAILTRSGLVKIPSWHPICVVLDRPRLARHKNSAQKNRGRIPARLRNRVLDGDKNLCSSCGKPYPSDELEIDHIIPASLLGADHPGNWTALCSKCNREKLDRSWDSHIRHYRGHPVRGHIGVRFRDGVFWPHINGRVRIERR